MIGALLAACVVLAILQYRWTGELSQAESQRLLGTAAGRLQQFARAFDTGLRQSVQELIPSAEEVRALGPRQANEQRLRGATLDPPIFRRIASAIPDASRKLQFFEANLTDRTVVSAPWPESPDWKSLRQKLQGMADGGGMRGTIVDPLTALIEVPVFVDGEEREWMMFEVDTDYVAKTWLPELIRTYIDPEAGFQPVVQWSGNPSKTILGDRIPHAKVHAEATFFPVGFVGPAGRRGGEGGRWRVSLSHAAGSVPAAVQAARWRNLAIAFVPLLLIATAGVALVRNSRRAQRLAAAQYQFFAGISHELRTPLTVIQGAGHNLLTGIVQDEAQRETYAQAIVKQSTQLREMVDQLLSYGAATRSPLPSEAAGSASLDIAVSEAIEAVAPELEQNQRAVDVDMPPDLPLVRGDQTTLRRILGNLISNAIRHGGGEVAVSASRIGSMVEVRVADSGEGIAAEELNQVFDPFFRGKRARTGRTRGTGLGLSLVKETVERLGGKVFVESQLGKGTVFIVKLPVAE